MPEYYTYPDEDTVDGWTDYFLKDSLFEIKKASNYDRKYRKVEAGGRWQVSSTSWARIEAGAERAANLLRQKGYTVKVKSGTYSVTDREVYDASGEQEHGPEYSYRVRAITLKIKDF